MIERALNPANGELVYADSVSEQFDKGAYVCPYCERPMLPVEGRFWRIYPGEDHTLGYCKTISKKDGAVHNPALTREFTFFSNYKRPEKEFSEPDDGGLAQKLMEQLEAGQSMSGDEMDAFLKSITASPDTGSSGKPSGSGKQHLECSARTMADLFFERFHESRLSTPMFHGTRGDYMIFPDNAARYLEANHGQIIGPRIISAKFTGFNEKTHTLLFSLTKAENPGTPGEKSSLAARIEMTCRDEDYFYGALLPKFIRPAGENSAGCSYRYRDCRVWLRGNFKWAESAKCGGKCLFLDKHAGMGCSSCSGVARAELKTSAQILITNWQGFDGRWETLEPRKTSGRKAG